MSSLPITHPGTEAGAGAPPPDAEEHHRSGLRILKYLSTTDHKVIGNMYFVTVFCFFLFGGGCWHSASEPNWPARRCSS